MFFALLHRNKNETSEKLNDLHIVTQKVSSRADNYSTYKNTGFPDC